MTDDDTSTPRESRSILTEFSKLDGAYRCPLHQKSGEWPDNPCPVCASNALKLDLAPLELDVEAAARSREKTRALLDTIELTPAQKKMAEAAGQYFKRRLESTWTCEIEKTAPAVVGLPDNGGEE